MIRLLSLTPSRQRRPGPLSGEGVPVHHHRPPFSSSSLVAPQRLKPSGRPRQCTRLLMTGWHRYSGSCSSKARPRQSSTQYPNIKLLLGDHRCPQMCEPWKNWSVTCCTQLAAAQCPLGVPVVVRPGECVTTSSSLGPPHPARTLAPQTGGPLRPVGEGRWTTFPGCCPHCAEDSQSLLSFASVQAGYPTPLLACMLVPLCHCLPSWVCLHPPERQDRSMAVCHQEFNRRALEAGCRCPPCPIPCWGVAAS